MSGKPLGNDVQAEVAKADKTEEWKYVDMISCKETGMIETHESPQLRLCLAKRSLLVNWD